MSQHDMIIDNQTGAAARADINLALQALASLNSGASAPATTYAYMPWYDTTVGVLKIRNGANSAWIIIGPLADSTQHVIYTNNLARVYVDTDGKVGIGDATPSYELDVNGDINATGAVRVGGVALTPGYNFINAGTSANSGDTFTATPSPAISAYANNQLFHVLLNATNTTTTPTFNFNSQGAKTVKKQIGGAKVAVSPGDLQANTFALLAYDGTNLILYGARTYSQGSNIASATSPNFDTATGDYVHVTGTTTIATPTLSQGREITVVFDGALQLTNGANFILPTGANITTAAGDVAVIRGEASSVVRVISFQRKDGTTVGGGTMQTQNASAVAITGGTIAGCRLYHTQFTLADDTATSFSQPVNTGYFWLSRQGLASGLQNAYGQTFGSGGMASIAEGTNIDIVTAAGTLAGTTGVDGQFSVKANTGPLFYAENRLGSSANNMVVTFIG